MSLSDDLVEPGWLASRLGDERLRVLDVTVQITPEFVTSSGRSGWEMAHVPGSVLGYLHRRRRPGDTGHIVGMGCSGT
jgi:3-mercaptopyruvate sulfurtransferase SseA